MSKTTVHLCIGGPADRTYFAAPQGMPQVRIPQVPPLASMAPIQSQVPDQTTVSYSWYQKQFWQAGREEFAIWVPIDQTPTETFQILLDGYRSGRTG